MSRILDIEISEPACYWQPSSGCIFRKIGWEVLVGQNIIANASAAVQSFEKGRDVLGTNATAFVCFACDQGKHPDTL